MTQSLKKTYVLDTNVLLSDASSLFSFQEHDVIIPMVVLEELDNHKNRQDEVGQNARKVSRTLDEMRATGKSLFSGVELPNGGTLKIVSINETAVKELSSELAKEKVDNQLIAFMLQLRTQTESAVLVSKDINVRLKCEGLNVKCDDYLKMRVVTDTDKFYTGVALLDVDDAQIQEFFQTGYVKLPEELTAGFFPNQIIILKSLTSKSGIARFLGQGEAMIKIAPVNDVFGLKPRNKEQNFSFDLLLDREIKLLTLTGRAGTGKTLLALAAGLQQLKGLGPKETAVYDKIIVTRPVQPLGRDIGFLPGSLEEKMEPWIAPIRDNLNFLMQHRSNARRPKTTGDGKEPYLSLLQSRGLIEIEAITFIRGRSIPNSMIIIDEAQNLSMHELKTIITRVGDGTKIVLTGDIEQIDNTHVDVYTNGLTYAIEKFKEFDISAHVTLLKGERSELATLASKIL